ncbi:Myb/SANT-like domain [Sesbania bispinosa]|nr:Myb/SANT-like domain [Sesbania bispinosa]
MSKGRGQSAEPSQGTREVHSLRPAGYVSLTKQHIKNRMKTMKGRWREAYDLFNSLSIFVWNPIIKRFEAEEEVWEGFIRGTGRNAWSGRQIFHTYHREKETIDLNDACDDACGDTSMHDQDGPVGDETQQSAPNVDSFSPANVQSNQSTGTPGSRGTKCEAPMVDLVEAQMERLSSGLRLVADAPNTGNAISKKLHDVAERQLSIAERQATAIEKRNNIIQRTTPRIYSETDVWDMLTEINVMEQYRLKMVGSRSKRLRNGKAKKVAARTTAKPSSESKKNNMEGRSTLQLSKNGKLKNSVNDLTLLQSLDYSRFFSNDNQVESYLEGFLARPSDWLTIAGLKYEGEKFDTTKIHTWEYYNHTKAVRGMIRSGLQIPKKLNAWNLRVEDRLLHYTYARILIPRGSLVAPNDEVEEAAAAPAEPGSLPQGNHGEHSLNNLSKYVGELNSKMDKKFDELGMQMKVVEDQLAQVPSVNDHA